MCSQVKINCHVVQDKSLLWLPVTNVTVLWSCTSLYWGGDVEALEKHAGWQIFRGSGCIYWLTTGSAAGQECISGWHRWFVSLAESYPGMFSNTVYISCIHHIAMTTMNVAPPPPRHLYNVKQLHALVSECQAWKSTKRFILLIVLHSLTMTHFI